MNSNQLSVISVLTGAMLLLGGCEGFRYAATEAQRENAWLHRNVCAAAADAAVDEDASDALCGLTSLAHEQSGAFVADYGVPENVILACKNPLPPSGYSSFAGGELSTVAAQAKADSIRRPDVFEMADGMMELGIALAGLLGGAYGIRIAGHLKAAREKSKALKEIVEGNELFKQLWPEQADRFKEAQQKQSSVTKQLVTQLKAG